MSYMLDSACLIVFPEENPHMPLIYCTLKKGCWTIGIQRKEDEELLPLMAGSKSLITSLSTVIEELLQECSLALSKVPDSISLSVSDGSNPKKRS